VRPRKRGRIVNTVAGHHHNATLALQLLYHPVLLIR
jgi:hypothetical protein